MADGMGIVLAKVTILPTASADESEGKDCGSDSRSGRWRGRRLRQSNVEADGTGGGSDGRMSRLIEGERRRSGQDKEGLHTDGQRIAVKILHPMLHNLDDTQFEQEYHNLESLQHQNIVRLVGYCNETRREFVSFEGRTALSERTHRALCFEYMQNGNLDNHLSDESSGHDWHTRYAIIKGIAKGLKYLHVEFTPPMFHLDLKPANVLLDENWVAKIGDFGLSRFMQNEQTHITTSSIGTIGYLPPEYIDGGVISNKFDIFSLGVIMIKVSGNWRNRLQAALMDPIEPYCEQIRRCITIALACVEPDRHRGPTIGYILNELNQTETMGRFPDVSPSDPGSSMNQETRQTDITEVEENREREELSRIENLFGEVVDNYKLDQMASYMGKSKTRDDQVREACILVEEDNKDAKATRYVDGLKTMHGNGDGQSTLCLVYNATGGTLHHVLQHDWSGHIGRAPCPALIGNGQWAAFHHVAQPGEPDSLAAVVYRGKNKDGDEHDYSLRFKIDDPILY
ncbi:probable serine/threonine-protein kinase At1g01540 [Triticum aestivum]|uniref:probable serine/threonine-protein kinase At1g01540 n=1 Tax=Triticum aestivum TaxID=4565 RepID=UPI001D029263|nr:probable serine/threonine-protein kinase At1g01540 [Triticum aestivum]